jgi:hypothetical protein
MEFASENAHTAGRKNEDSIRHLVQACFSLVKACEMPRVYCGHGARRQVPDATGTSKRRLERARGAQSRKAAPTSGH